MNRSRESRALDLDFAASSPRTAFISLDPALPSGCRTRAAHRTRGVLRSLAGLGCELHLFSPRFGVDLEGLTEPTAIHPLPMEKASDAHEAEEACLGLNHPLRCSLDSLEQDRKSDAALGLVYERRFRWSYAGLEWARSRRIPSILEVDNRSFDEAQTMDDPVHEKAVRVIARRAVSAATTTIATTELVADWVRSLGVQEDRLHVVEGGADPDRFAALAKATPVLHGAELPLTIGFVGWLGHSCGLDILFEAFAHLPDRKSADRLLVVGNGPKRRHFNQVAMDLGIASQINWEPEEFLELPLECLARMDIVVAPYLAAVSEWEGLGQLFDCMAASRPIIATRLKPIQAVLQHGHSAWLVRPDDSAEIVAAISILRRHTTLRAYLAGRARAVLRDRHTWNHVVQTILEHVRSDSATL